MMMGLPNAAPLTKSFLSVNKRFGAKQLAVIGGIGQNQSLDRLMGNS
jgi:tRNA A37 threonylcarbamoyltransferase TsaD